MNTINNLQFVVLNPEKVALMQKGEQLDRERQAAAAKQLEIERRLF